MALTKITPQMFDTSAAGHDFNIDNGTFVVDASTNRVGIGTSSPDHKLHLEESDTTPVYLKTQNSAAALLIGNNSAGNSYISAQTSGKPLLLETQNTERMRIDASGNAIFTKSGGAYLQLKDASAVRGAINVGTSDGLIFTTGSSFTERLRIDASGALQLGGTTDAGFIDFDGQSLQLNSQRNPNTGAFVNTGKSHASIGLSGASGGSTISFRTASANNTVGTERMRITSAGALAIGRTSSITAACLELQPPAQISDFSSYILNIGGDEADDAVGTKSGIGFGYTSSARTAAPATIGYETQATTGGTYGDLYFATRQGDGTGQPTVRMRINNDGHVTAPYNPAFRAYLSTEQTSNGEVTSGWTDSGLAQGRTYDRDGDFNTSNGRFTAPVDGVYLFSVMWDSNASQAGFDMLVNGGSNYHVRWEPTGRTDNAWESRHYSTHVKLDKNDYVTLYIRHASGSYPVHMGGAYWGHFAGCLIS